MSHRMVALLDRPSLAGFQAMPIVSECDGQSFISDLAFGLRPMPQAERLEWLISQHVAHDVRDCHVEHDLATGGPYAAVWIGADFAAACVYLGVRIPAEHTAHLVHGLGRFWVTDASGFRRARRDWRDELLPIAFRKPSSVIVPLLDDAGLDDEESWAARWWLARGEAAREAVFVQAAESDRRHGRPTQGSESRLSTWRSLIEQHVARKNSGE